MPVLDGIEFYRHASANDPKIGQRIMFFSPGPAGEHTDFIRKNNQDELSDRLCN